MELEDLYNELWLKEYIKKSVCDAHEHKTIKGMFNYPIFCTIRTKVTVSAIHSML